VAKTNVKNILIVALATKNIRIISAMQWIIWAARFDNAGLIILVALMSAIQRTQNIQQLWV
jgi:hypothetical protein